MDKKTIIAVALSFIVILVWSQFFTPNAPVQKHEGAAEQANAPKVAEVPAPTPAPTQAKLPEEVKAKEAASLGQAPTLSTYKTDNVSITFNDRTGDIRSASILGWQNDTKTDNITFNSNGTSDYSKLIIPVGSTYEKSEEDLPSGKRITYTTTLDGLIISKVYEIENGSYIVKSTVDIQNNGSSSLSVPIKVQIGPRLGAGFGEPSSYVFEGAMISDGSKTESVALEKTDNEQIVGNPKWAGYTSKYFLFAAASDSLFNKAYITPEDRNPVAIIEGSVVVNPSDRQKAEFSYYIGPKYYTELKSHNLGLQKSMDYGWFYFIAIPMLYILNWFHSIFGNYGVAIIILTIIIKLVTLPLTLKSMYSMKEMSKLQPRILELKERYKSDPQKLNQATMDLYKAHNVNPLSGCLPMLLQIPIFFALYKALLLSLELKGAPFIFWLTDLSEKDPYYITPIIMGASMFIQQKMTPSTADPMQQKIFLAMPILFTILFINFQSGLVLYWLVNNLLSIVQQYFINKRGGGVAKSVSKPAKAKK